MKSLEKIPKTRNILNLHDVGDLRFETIDNYNLTNGCVLVKIKYCGICSSDIERIFVNGTYNFPTIPGHEMSGQIVATNDEDEKLLGKRVVIFPLMPCNSCEACNLGEYAQCADYNYFGSRCDGGYSEYLLVPKWNLVFFNDSIDYKIAALCEPAAVALHSVNIANIEADDSIVINGTGTIGLLIALMAKFKKADVTIAGRSEESLSFSKKLGFNTIINNKDCCSFNKVFEVVGSNESINQSINFCDNFGTVVLVGNPKSDILIDKSIYWKILRKQLILKGIWNSNYNSKFNDWNDVLNLMNDSNIPFDKLITKTFKMSNFEDAFKFLRDDNEKKLKVMFENE